MTKHLLGGHPRACTSIPTSTQVAQGMTYTESRAGQKRPLLATKPVFILEEIRVGENRIQREKGCCVEMSVPRFGNMQRSALDVWRKDGNRSPGCVIVQHRKDTKRRETNIMD